MKCASQAHTAHALTVAALLLQELGDHSQAPGFTPIEALPTAASSPARHASSST
ncbi:hypothetical protein SSOG_00042 [Streptomyces himastatinicus ATCC 53653]|uniref:Uncharacterized protein n=1 Tax=Streptomyces himastatinicus ATCC 53653 TaxID=457427 RepID=D9W5X4_9ACTN|nr:hypothetical protein SSOG_00042 [Streptomyces himastatinicus ATCC 53653]